MVWDHCFPEQVVLGMGKPTAPAEAASKADRTAVPEKTQKPSV